MPDELEAMGLLAIMLYADARRLARRDKDGNYVPLAEQDPSQWNTTKIEEAEKLLFDARSCSWIRRYQLEAAIQSARKLAWTLYQICLFT